MMRSHARRLIALVPLAVLLLLVSAPAGMADLVVPQQTPKVPKASLRPAVSPTVSVSPSTLPTGASGGSGRTIALAAGGAAVLAVAAVSLMGLRRISRGDHGEPAGPQDPATGGPAGGEVDG